MDRNEVAEAIAAAARYRETELDLSDSELTILPPQIAKLSMLQSLDISGNQLKRIPPEIGYLNDLRTLDASQNHIRELAPEIGHLTSLEQLDLSNNALVELPATIGDIGHLKHLDLSNNQLRSLPADIGRLVYLEDLVVQENALQNLTPEVGRLRALRELILDNNRLDTLPPEVSRLEGLTVLSLEANPLTTFPPEIRNQGIRGIQAYLRAQLKETHSRWESKLLVVGEGGTGKTSLLKVIRGLPFDPEEPTTHGLEIMPVTLVHPTNSRTTMLLKTWDFGGQEIYHATHQFFLSNRSLFLLVWNARQGFDQGKPYKWLDTIKALAPVSPIVLVATHIDERTDAPLEQLRRDYPQIAATYSISSRTGVGIEEIRSVLSAVAAKLPLMGEPWPTRWSDAAEAIRKLPNNYATPGDVFKTMKAHGVIGDDQLVLARWLHDLGAILILSGQPRAERCGNTTSSMGVADD